MRNKTSSSRSKKELSKLQLGEKTIFSTRYDPNLLQTIKNQNPESEAWTSFICTEFTSLCPKTGQPDFARIYINYIANRFLVESKSLKLYLGSFRNHGDFHEDCIQKICNDLAACLKPRYLEVIGEFTPRGGIAIYPYSNHSSQESRYKKLKIQRTNNYRPGLYSVSLSELY